MVSPEASLIQAAGDNFYLIAFSIMLLFFMAVFSYSLKTIMDTNRDANNNIVSEMRNIASCLKEANDSICNKLEIHDQQAKRILDTDTAIRITLENRPCIKDK